MGHHCVTNQTHYWRLINQTQAPALKSHHHNHITIPSTYKYVMGLSQHA